MLNQGIFEKSFEIDIEELNRDDWKLHKQLVLKGINLIEITKTIRNDDVEKLRKITTQTNFDFNQTN